MSGGRHVIKIRYAELPGGLHARAEARQKDTIVFLLPGLTPAQRVTALRQLRRNSRLGRSPRLSTAGMARARMADSARVNATSAVTALRLHPILTGTSVLLLLSVAATFLLSAESSVSSGPLRAAAPRATLPGPPSAGPGPQRPVSGNLRRRPAGRHDSGTPAGEHVPALGVTPALQPVLALPVTPTPAPASQPAPSPTTAGPSPSPSPRRHHRRTSQGEGG